MPWNEPGGNGGRDPWGSRGPGSGPPDLDELVRKMQQKLGGLFSGRGGGARSGSGGGSSLIWLFVLILGLAGLIYEVSYIIQPAERGVVRRFGKYVATLEPGLNIRLPRPFETVTKVDVDQVRVVPHKASMLTQDENIVDIQLDVQYRIKNVVDYLFNARLPDDTVRQATETSVREVIGTSQMDFIMTEGRGETETNSKARIQEILDAYGTGLIVTDVNMQPAKPPEEVKSAFDDAIKAREDEQRLINEAEAYRNEIIPKARGGAARIVAEANAYKEQVVKRAEGETARFLKLLAEYEKAPGVTRERLYLEAMESVLSKTNKVLLDADNGTNIMYLPLDRLLNRGGDKDAGQSTTGDHGASGSLTAGQDIRERSEFRSRETR